MSCHQVEILNYNHNVVALSDGNTLVITDNNACTSVTIPQPVTCILQVNSPGPQGSMPSPIGPDGAVQFKSGSEFSGEQGFRYDYTNNNVIISGSGYNNTIFQIHSANDDSFAFGIYNDTYNPTQAVLAGFIWNDGKASIGTEVDKPLEIYTNAGYYNPTLTISSSGVTINNTLQQGLNVIASGSYSHAEGESTIASGSYSHAEGSTTTAVGYASHAEGISTTANGNYSHAEGVGTIAQGNWSHAEGDYTIASGSYSHAEGESTIASGSYSHAEGESTIAYGVGSHTEGLGTIASGFYQHVQGQYNIPSPNQSAFIIGNGTGDNNRSNLIFAVGNTVQITGSLTVSSSNTFTNIGPAVFSGSIIVTNGITGSLLGTASYALNSISASQSTTASYVQNAQTASYVLNAINAQTASNILGGKATHIPYFKTDTTLATSSLYQSGSGTVIINQDNATSENPEALYVWQPNPTSINVISGKGNLNSYLQLNIQNTNQGTDASSDVVATAGNGNEEGNYIDMGINSDNFSGYLGGPNDAYLYTTGSHLHIGNATPNKPIQFFVGGPDTDINRKLELNADGFHNITGSLEIDTDLTVLGSITGSLYGTASWAISSSYATTASYASNVPETASHALQADNASTANFATTAGNGGVTNIVAGSGVTLIPSNGVGAVTVIATGTGGVTIISGSNVTESFALSTAWIFNHNLQTRFPIITVFDTNYNQIIPQNIELTNTASATITFPTAESGFAVASLGGTTGTVLSSSYALQSTYASTASVYAETDPVFNAKSSSLATTGSNIFKGNQTISGSLIITGSNTLIGNKTISGSVFITGSKTIIGNNIVTGSMITTGSIILVGNQTITGSLIVSGSGTFTNIGPAVFSGSVTLLNGATGSLLGTASFSTTSSYSSNTDLLDGKDSTTFATTGSNTFIGNQVVTGSLFTSGSNTLIGNTVLSGSISVSGSSTILGTTTMTGSLNITGSTTQTGNNTLIGNTTLSGSISVSGSQLFKGDFDLTGSFTVSGSTEQIGNNTLIGNTVLSGSISVSGSQTFKGNMNLTGSLTVSGSTFQIGNNTLSGNTVLSGSITISGSTTNTIIGNTQVYGEFNVSGSSVFSNSTFIVTGSQFFTGSSNIIGNQTITGSLNVLGDINVVSGSAFTRWGNKLFNYAQFAETSSLAITQNVSGAFLLPTTYFSDGIRIVSSSRITFENTGLYNIQFSAVVNQGAGKPDFSIWFKQTGSNIANSNTIATLQANSQTLLAWNFAYPFASGSYVEMWYNTTAANTVLTGTAAINGQPAAPALIVTVTQIA